MQRLIDQMVDARLLVVQTMEGGKGSTVEIVHESLIQNWPTLRRWLDETQEDAAIIDQLRTASRQWAAKGARRIYCGAATPRRKRRSSAAATRDISRISSRRSSTRSSYEQAVARRKRVLVIGAFIGMVASSSPRSSRS